MSDNEQQSIMQELERLLPYIRLLKIDNKVTADEKAARSEAAIGEQIAKVLASNAAIARETEQQRAARKRVAAAEASPIIEAIKTILEASNKPSIEPIQLTIAERDQQGARSSRTEKVKASRPYGLPAKRDFL